MPVIHPNQADRERLANNWLPLHGALTLWGDVDGSSAWPKKDRIGALAP
jgi:hypothetical protein